MQNRMRAIIDDEESTDVRVVAAGGSESSGGSGVDDSRSEGRRTRRQGPTVLGSTDRLKSGSSESTLAQSKFVRCEISC